MVSVHSDKIPILRGENVNSISWMEFMWGISEVYLFMSLNFSLKRLKLGRYCRGTRALFPTAITSMMKVVLGGLYKMIRNPSMDTNNLF